MSRSTALQGQGPADLMDVTLELGAELLLLTDPETTRDHARQRLQKAVDSRRGLEKFREMVAAQGGDLDAPRPVAPAQDVAATQAGWVAAIHTEQLGRVIIELGGGRKKLDDVLDLSTGLEMLVRLGDRVDQGQPLVRVFARPDAAASVQDELLAAITIGDTQVDPPPLIVERIQA